MITFEVNACNSGLSVWTKLNGHSIALDRFNNIDEVTEAKERLKERAMKLVEQAKQSEKILNS
jgi:hypothetical protein